MLSERKETCYGFNWRRESRKMLAVEELPPQEVRSGWRKEQRQGRRETAKIKMVRDEFLKKSLDG